MKNLLCEKKTDKELIFISETISRGTLSAYLRIFKYPKLTVCQTWFRQILEGLQYLHAHNITHGHLSCDHIYINSNTGELKIGDLCLVKLPEALDGRFTYNFPLDDVRCFGIIALEVAFAQLLSPTKLKKVMKRLYDPSLFDKKYAARLAKHIIDNDYRSLVETCIYADSTVTINDLLGHKFFITTRAKDETLRSVVQKSIKQSKIKNKFNLIVTKNTLKDNAISNSHTIDIQITFINQEIISKIKFQYDMNEDTPEGILKEMREVFPIPEEYIQAIKQQINNALKSYIDKWSKDIRDYVRNQYNANNRCPSISGSISPIDTSSAASAFMPNTTFEHFNAIYGSMRSTATKALRGREEALQPEVLYSDVQITPRENCEEDKGRINMKRYK